MARPAPAKPIEPIRRSARRLVRELHLLDGRHTIEGFSFSECHLLTELDKLGEATASELAARLVLEKSTMSRLVEGLRKRGCLVARKDRSDRRRHLLRLTADGRRGAERVHRYARHQVATALEYVPESDRHQLAAALERYARALQRARLAASFGIRPVRRSDNAAVAAVIREVMTEFGAVGEGFSIEDPEVDDMFAHYQPPRARFWVIERQERVLGCGGIGPLEGGDAGTCELRKMYFLEEIRGLGLGCRLLNRCLDAARHIGYRQCYLETLDHMTGARRLYERHGFRRITAPLGCTGHVDCNTWMVKALDAPA